MEKKELAGCVIVNEQGELLLIHRRFQDLAQWELPGGKVENGEKHEEAAIRELLEEIGVDVQIIERIGNARFTLNDIDWNYTWFRAEILDDLTPTIKEPDLFDKIQYWPIESLRTRNDISLNVVNLLKAIR